MCAKKKNSPDIILSAIHQARSVLVCPGQAKQGPLLGQERDVASWNGTE